MSRPSRRDEETNARDRARDAGRKTTDVGRNVLRLIGPRPHDPPSQQSLVHVIRRGARLAAGAVAVLGLTVLFGWAFDVELLESALPDTVTMKPNTALCLVLIGAAMLLLPRRTRASRLLATGCATAVGVIGVATVLEYATGTSLMLDEALFRESDTPLFTTNAGRMAPTTAVALLCLAFAVLAALYGRRRLVASGQFVAIGAAVLGLVVVDGYINGAPEPGWEGPTAMAVHTAIALVLGGGVAFFAHPTLGLAAVVTGGGVSGMIGRRLLVAAVLIPPVLGRLRILGQEHGLYGPRTGTTLLVSGHILVLGAIVLMTTANASRLESAATSVTHRLSEAQMVARLGTWDLDLDTGFVQLSDELRALLGLSTGSWHRAQLRLFLQPDEADRVDELIDRAILTGKPFTDELRVSRVDGARREMVIFGEPMVGADRMGVPVRKLWGVMQDVTEVRHAQRDAAQAHADWQAEHRVLELFQEAMLPTGLVPVPGAELAATYLAAADRLDIGGDWYEAFTLADGRIMLSIGDVAGHDQSAAATMGPVRTVLRAFVVENPDPASALARLNRFIALGYPVGTLVTAIVAIYDPKTRHLRWANAGHPPPILATRQESAELSVELFRAHGFALGVAAEAAYSVECMTVPAGAALCYYTDGLLERRESAPGADQARLVRSVARVFGDIVDGADPERRPAHRMVEQITHEMLWSRPPEDDVCVLVLCTAPGDPGEVAAPGGAEERADERDSRPVPTAVPRPRQEPPRDS